MFSKVSADPHDPHHLPSQIGEFDVERRRSHREAVVAIGRLTPLEPSDDGRPLQILVTDLSLHGCDFKAAAKPRDGAFYRLDVCVGPLTLSSRVRIIRLEMRTDWTYEVGGEFI